MALFADSYMTRVPIKFARSFIYLSIYLSVLAVLEKQKMLKEGDKNLIKMAYFSKPFPAVPNFAQIAKGDVHSGQLFVITHPKLKCN